MGQRYLNAAAAAEYLGYGTGETGAATIRQLVHRRQVPFIKVGKFRNSPLRFDVKALDAWLDKHRNQVQEIA
jgi:hypothetical protein